MKRCFVISSAILTTSAKIAGGKSMQGISYYYNNARFRDAILAGSFYQQDPLAEKYYPFTPYHYSACNPLKYKDKGGKLVIFVNGFHFGDGGTAKYWSGVDKTIMNILNDDKALYIDGAIGGIKNILDENNSDWNLHSNVRYKRGLQYGYDMAETILKSLDENEKIKFATHSMGAMYAKGMIAGIQNYAKDNDIDLSNIFDFEMDLAPYQPHEQTANKEVKTFTISHLWDGVAGSYPIRGADNYISRKFFIPLTSLGLLNEHSISTFTGEEINYFYEQSIHKHY